MTFKTNAISRIALLIVASAPGAAFADARRVSQELITLPAIEVLSKRDLDDVRFYLSPRIQLDTTISRFSAGDVGKGFLNDQVLTPAGVPVAFGGGEASGLLLDFNASNTTLAFGTSYRRADGLFMDVNLVADGRASFGDEFGQGETNFDLTEAYARIGGFNDRGDSLTFGQTWTNLQNPDAVGRTLNYLGTPGGNFFDRKLSVRYDIPTSFGGVFLALEEPKQAAICERDANFGFCVNTGSFPFYEPTDYPDQQIEFGAPAEFGFPRYIMPMHRSVDGVFGASFKLGESLTADVRGAAVYNYYSLDEGGQDKSDGAFGGLGVFSLTYQNPDNPCYGFVQASYGVGENASLGGVKASDFAIDEGGDINNLSAISAAAGFGGELGAGLYWNTSASYFKTTEDDIDSIDETWGVNFNVLKQIVPGFHVGAEYMFQKVQANEFFSPGLPAEKFEGDANVARLSVVYQY